jgi:hypothetical protein
VRHHTAGESFDDLLFLRPAQKRAQKKSNYNVNSDFHSYRKGNVKEGNYQKRRFCNPYGFICLKIKICFPKSMRNRT